MLDNLVIAGALSRLGLTDFISNLGVMAVHHNGPTVTISLPGEQTEVLSSRQFEAQINQTHLKETGKPIVFKGPSSYRDGSDDLKVVIFENTYGHALLNETLGVCTVYIHNTLALALHRNSDGFWDIID
ncbi:hypothetical protein PP187_gp048 [Klebsiella phage vB_KvM-Eowyn]|uniref:Uncharacterized protein n=1 Tax=Klebsiella phage vB_KvM-Eowyn TaxID=2762819 RepID=A0A7R8MJA5_9CAUD|nr:hypothetical protein PP187_gp048 [Klebsiella phage vB_KvM-Eowyn]CAD5236037.1 hypothetical protein LLCLJKAH_00048 [Klebsiella phage vB_KvM-Eowyn]